MSGDRYSRQSFLGENSDTAISDCIVGVVGLGGGGSHEAVLRANGAGAHQCVVRSPGVRSVMRLILAQSLGYWSRPEMVEVIL